MCNSNIEQSSTQKQAKCVYCGELADSKNKERLPFFEERKECKYDKFYCGCRGWE